MRLRTYSCIWASVSLLAAMIIQTGRPLTNANGVSAEAARGASTEAPEVRKPQVLTNYGKLPLSFEVNRGQTDQAVKFLSRGKGYTLFLTSTDAVLSLRKGSAEPEAQVPRLVNDPGGTGVSPVGAGADLLRSGDSADPPILRPAHESPRGQS